MIGVIRKTEKHSKEEWDFIHTRLEWNNRKGEKEAATLFLVSEIKRWRKSHKNIELYIYEQPGDIQNYVSEEKKQVLSEKWKTVKSADWDYVSWTKKHGFNIEYRNLKAIQKNGYIYHMDYHSDDLNVKDKHRVVPNAEKNRIKYSFWDRVQFGV